MASTSSSSSTACYLCVHTIDGDVDVSVLHKSTSDETVSVMVEQYVGENDASGIRVSGGPTSERQLAMEIPDWAVPVAVIADQFAIKHIFIEKLTANQKVCNC